MYWPRFGLQWLCFFCRPRQRQRQYVRSTWLTVPKNSWPRHSKTGEEPFWLR